MRYFTVIDYPKKGDVFGVYRALSPKRAANRAFTKLGKIFDVKNENDKWLVFYIQEVFVDKKDNLNRGKIYKYIGTRVQLVKPIERNINGKIIQYKFKNIVGQLKK